MKAAGMRCSPPHRLVGPNLIGWFHALHVPSRAVPLHPMLCMITTASSPMLALKPDRLRTFLLTVNAVTKVGASHGVAPAAEGALAQEQPVVSADAQTRPGMLLPVVSASKLKLN